MEQLEEDKWIILTSCKRVSITTKTETFRCEVLRARIYHGVKNVALSSLTEDRTFNLNLSDIEHVDVI